MFLQQRNKTKENCRVDAQALCSFLFAVVIKRGVHMTKNFQKDLRISSLHTVDGSEIQLISLRFVVGS